VTVAFQTFFAAWVARVMGGGVWYLAPVLCAVGALGVGKRRWAFAVAAAMWVVSLAAIAVTVAREGEAGLLPELASWPGALPRQEIVPLAMVCVLGFMLCPYLDRTFHRARIETAGDSGRAFSLGFGLVFALMIAGTLLTAPVLVWVVSPSGNAGGLAAGRVLIALFAAHTLPQLVFTCWVHGMEGESAAERAGLGFAALLAGLGVLVSGDCLLRPYGWTGPGREWANPLFGGEVAYRCFMAFYGLAAPAYVAIVSWPVKLGGAEVRRARVVVFAVVVLAAVWFYWVGFVERRTWWVAVGVGMVVVGKLAGRFVEYQSSKFKVQSSNQERASD